MKSGSMFIIFVLFSTILFSQEVENKKQFFLGGAANFTIQDNYLPSSSLRYFYAPGTYSTSSSDFKYTHFSFSPYIGKELGSDWLAGINFTFGRSVSNSRYINYFPQTSETNFLSIDNYYQIGFFARYTFLPDHKLNVFIQPFANYIGTIYRSETNGTDNEKINTKSIQMGSNFGLTYRLNDSGRLMVRSGLISFISGSWEEELKGEKDSFSSLSMSLNFSNLVFGYEWLF